MARKPPTQINRLSASMQYALMTFVKERYSESKLLDTAFVKVAEEALGFPVTVGNLQGCREAFGIECNRDVIRRESQAPETRLDRLENELKELRVLVEVLTTRVVSLQEGR